MNNICYDTGTVGKVQQQRDQLLMAMNMDANPA